MNLLPDHEIKQYQLSLLENDGPSLAEFSTNNDQAFKVSNNRAKLFQKNKLNVVRWKTMGFSSNANIKGFICILLNTIYGPNVNQDILTVLKSTFYDSQINVAQIKHNTFPQLNNTQAKKLLVQFFYSLAYSSENDKIQAKFLKYPIIIDILTTCLRAILTKFKVKYANNFLFKIPTDQILQILVAYFDLNCKLSKSLFLFYQENFFLIESENHEIIIGKYSQSIPAINSFIPIHNWKNQSLNSIQSQVEFNKIIINRLSTDRQQSSRQNISIQYKQIMQGNNKADNHKGELKKIICQTLNDEYQHHYNHHQEAPTPFFNAEIPVLNFRNHELRKSKDITPLDSKRHSSFGNHISIFEPIQQMEIQLNGFEKRFSQSQKQTEKKDNYNILTYSIKPQTIKSLKRSRSESSFQKKSKQNHDVQQKDSKRNQKFKCSSVVNQRQKAYSEYNSKSNQISESNASKQKRTIQYSSNIYSINISNISKAQQVNRMQNDEQRKKTQSVYALTNYPLENMYSKPQTVTDRLKTTDNDFAGKHINPERRSTKDKEDKFQVRQSNERPQQSKKNIFMFKKNKYANLPSSRFKDPIKKDVQHEWRKNHHFDEQNAGLKGLSECSLSPISYESQSYKSSQQLNSNQPKKISFTEMNAVKSQQFINHNKISTIQEKY